MKTIRLFLVFSFLFVSPLCAGTIRKIEHIVPDEPLEVITAYIINVVDGDTIDVYIDRRKQRIRLKNIETFESRKGKRAKEQAAKFKMTEEQVVAAGKEATKMLESLIGDNRIANIVYTVDNRTKMGDRLCGYVYVNPLVFSLNFEMLKKGYAFPYEEKK